jgi:CRP-like cAMP-binding protein
LNTRGLTAMVSSEYKFTQKCINCDCHHKSMLNDLHVKELDVIDEHKECVRYRKGDVIFHEGGIPKGIYCIKKGVVKISKMTSQGKEQILFLSQPGDFIGYRALIGEEVYNATATSIEDSSICYIPKSDFLEIMHRNPAFFNKMIKKVCNQLGIMEQNLTIIAQKSVKERLATTLLMLKESYGMDGDESTLIDIRLSREEIANVVGTATETVIRLLSTFKNEGLIDFDGKRIKVINEEQLKKLAVA